MSSTQTLLLGPYANDVQAAIRRLETEQVAKRLQEKDATLWSRDRAVQETIAQRLGWLDAPFVMAQRISVLRQLAEDARTARLAWALLLGMGGSGLFAEVCRTMFGVPVDGLDLSVLDTTDSAAIRSSERRGRLEQLLVVVSGKSGSTSEISALSKYFYHSLSSTAAVNGRAGAHCIAVTDAGTSLEQQAKAWHFRSIFTHGNGTGAEVGGRFSALTYFGLVPAALMGIDVGRLLECAQQTLQFSIGQFGQSPSADKNPPLQLGAVLAALALAGRDKLTLLCSAPLAGFGGWLEQLVAESTGKLGRGIIPVFGEPLLEPTAYGTDRVFIEMQLSGRRDEALKRRVQGLVDVGHPIVTIHWGDLYDLGTEVIRWSIATAVACCLLEINPFDEPNVKESKERTKSLLERYVKEGTFPVLGEEVFSGPEAVVSATAAAARRALSLSQCLAEFLQLRKPYDYFGVLSFLPRSDALDGIVYALRERLVRELGHAALIGFGPRYLHSTGQLFKGGPDTGLFLELTADEQDDLEIPGESFTFGVLKQAQALGDFQAMHEHDRRVLHIHLRGHLEESAKQLLASLDEAIVRITRR